MDYEYEIMPYIDDLELKIWYGRFVKCDSSWVAENVISPYSRIYYVTGGEGYLSYDGKEIIMKPNHLYFIPIGLKFDFRCDSNLEKCFFHINLFSNDYMDIFSTCKEIISFETDRAMQLKEIFMQGGVTSQMLLRSYIYEDLHKITRKANMENLHITKKSQLIQKALTYINTNLSVKMRVKEIAQNLYVAPVTLSKRFYEEMGIGIGHYIDLRIQFEAEKLLSEGELSIEYISEKLGFCDRFYFTRKFRENKLITPAKYRKQAEQNRRRI